MDHAARDVSDVIASYEGLTQRIAEQHRGEFLEIPITMAQAKVIYLLGTRGPQRMSDLVADLGVSLSTVSGLVERLVDQHLAARREDAADRRHVVVSLTTHGRGLFDRFRELNAAQLRSILERLDDAELSAVRAGIEALSRGMDRLAGAASPAPSVVPATGKGLA